MLEDTQEIWRDIKGYEGLYSVSNRGRVKNIKTGRILSGTDNGYGYKRINLKGKKYMVHKLVGLAFLDNPQNLPYINHIDENKKNNGISNLEWCTASYNTNYSIHNQSCKIKQIDKNGNLIKIWESSRQIGKETDYSQGNIINCCKGRYKQAYGFQWEYADPSQQHKFNRPIIVFKGNERIGEFPSLTKAANALGLKWRSVYHCLKGHLKSNKGYTFEYKQDPQP